jgi:hypothetical protein
MWETTTGTSYMYACWGQGTPNISPSFGGHEEEEEEDEDKKQMIHHFLLSSFFKHFARGK